MAAPLTGFIIAEDEALKKLLSGITVYDDVKSERTVRAFFRYPDSDVEQQYPFITIELLDIQHAVERETSAQTIYAQRYYFDTDPMEYLSVPSRLPYWPDETSDAGEMLTDGKPFGATVELTPVDFIYQVATYARNQSHDRQLTAKILGRDRIPFRYGELFVDADQTVRRLTNLGWQSADIIDNNAGGRKRIFRKVYTLSVNGEMGYDTLLATNSAGGVIINVSGQDETYQDS